MRFLTLADSPGWCFHRTASAMEKYHNSNHTWSTQFVNPKSLHPVKNADLVRIGGVPLFIYAIRNEVLPLDKQAAYVPTIASFKDIDKWGRDLMMMTDLIDAIIINDRRMESFAIKYGVPIIYSPDRVDHSIFHEMPHLKPKAGPLRVGWAGSIKFWKGVKHVNLIEEACADLGDKVEFVRQDRELDGLKGPHEMASWFNSLDVYVSANENRTCTPVPQLEALSCGVTTITTRCGELWPYIQMLAPTWMIERPTGASIASTLAVLAFRGRKSLHDETRRVINKLNKRYVTWECGEAHRATKVLEQIAWRYKSCSKK